MLSALDTLRNIRALEQAQSLEDYPAHPCRNGVRYELIGPAEASDMLLNSKYQGQRNLSKLAVARYVEAMKNGKWNISETAIVLGVRSNVQHLLNGQHRLCAVVDSNIAQTFIVQRNEYATDLAMDRAYAAMDQGTKRTPRQGLIALGAHERLGVPIASAEAAVAALRAIGGRFESDQYHTALSQRLKSAEPQDELLTLWHKEIYSYTHCIKGSDMRVQHRFLRKPVMAVGLLTMRYAPLEATQFWTSTALNNGLLRGQPERVLYDYLTLNDSRSRTLPYHCSVVAGCWNAFVQGREIQKVMGFEDRPISLKKTPFVGDSNIDATAILYAQS